MTPFKLLTASLALFLLASLPTVCALPATADAPTVRLSISKAQTPLTDALAQLAKQTGATILADDTVVDLLGVMSLSKPGLEEMLNQLKTISPGLTWQKVVLPSGAAVPDADTLSAQVRALKALSTGSLTVTDPTSHTTLAFSKQADARADDPAVAAPAGQLIYLVTNETVRADRAAAAARKAARQNAKAKTPAAGPTAQQGYWPDLSNEFAQMTPDQQRQALPQLFSQMTNILRNLDPSVRAQLRQQWRQNRNGSGAGSAQPVPGG